MRAVDVLSIALSGMRSAETRLAASAHNVANFSTEGFRPLRIHASTLEGGGSTSRAEAVALPEDVDLARELVDQMLAGHQFEASLRVLGAGAEMLGRVLDVFA